MNKDVYEGLSKEEKIVAKALQYNVLYEKGSIEDYIKENNINGNIFNDCEAILRYVGKIILYHISLEKGLSAGDIFKLKTARRLLKGIIVPEDFTEDCISENDIDYM